MNVFWPLAIIALTLVEVVTLLLVLAIARELGTVLVRLGPIGALPGSSGPAIGAVLKTESFSDLYRQQHVVGDGQGIRTLLLLVSPACSACETVVPGFLAFAREERDRTRLIALSVGDETTVQDYVYARRFEQAGVPYAVGGRNFFERIAVGATPYALLLEEDGTVTARGIVNTLQHLESLFYVEIFKDKGHERRHHTGDDENRIALTSNGGVAHD